MNKCVCVLVRVEKLLNAQRKPTMSFHQDYKHNNNMQTNRTLSLLEHIYTKQQAERAVERGVCPYVSHPRYDPKKNKARVRSSAQAANLITRQAAKFVDVVSSVLCVKLGVYNIYICTAAS
jgi:hypothetical protein